MLPPSAWIPNGAKPFGIFGSLKPPQRDRLERRVEDVDAAVVEVGRVQPVVRDREALVDGARRGAVGADDRGRAVHGRRPAEDRPASVANRKRAAPLLPFWLTTKSVALPLNTVPVGPPATATVSACLGAGPL